MNKISGIMLTFILAIGSKYPLQALPEPAKPVEPKKSTQETPTSPKAEIASTQINDAPTAGIKAPTVPVTKNSSETTGEINLLNDSDTESDEFQNVLIEKGAESDVDRAMEGINEEQNDKKNEAALETIQITTEERTALENIVADAAKELETNSGDAYTILEKCAEKMGISSLSSEMQNITMQNLKVAWNTLAIKYQNSSIPADMIEDFLREMDTTIKKAL